MSADYSAARNHMVDSQVRPNKVTDPRVLDAMRRLPREAFVPAARAALAYVDDAVPLGGGRVLMQPMVIARLVQLTRTRAGDRVLVVGAGTGYGAALLAACGGQVTALEADDALGGIAGSALTAHAPGVARVTGPLAAGWTDGAPWDVVLVEGAVQEIPPALAAQVRPVTGRVVAVLSDGNGACHAVLAEAVVSDGAPRLRTRAEFDCSTPMLPSLVPAAVFVF